MTFDEINIKAVDNLINILKDKEIHGSTTSSGYIVGNTKAVCFQDTPLYAITQNVEHERQRREKISMRSYAIVGLAFYF